MLKEVIDARVWGGIHFRTADTQGAVLGKKVAHYVEKHYFQPVIDAERPPPPLLSSGAQETKRASLFLKNKSCPTIGVLMVGF